MNNIATWFYLGVVILCVAMLFDAINELYQEHEPKYGEITFNLQIVLWILVLIVSLTNLIHAIH